MGGLLTMLSRYVQSSAYFVICQALIGFRIKRSPWQFALPISWQLEVCVRYQTVYRDPNYFYSRCRCY